MSQERYLEILRAVDAYNRRNGEGAAPPESPFIAQRHGRLGGVTDEIGVPEDELREFLPIVEKDLPQDHLWG